VLFQGAKLLVAGHQELPLARFSQARAGSCPLGSRAIRPEGKSWQNNEKSRRPAASSSAALARSLARRKRTADVVAEFRDERLTGDGREHLALPGVEEFGRRTWSAWLTISTRKNTRSRTMG